MDNRERHIEAAERVIARWEDTGMRDRSALTPAGKIIFDRAVAREVQAMIDADMDAAEYAGREG